MQQSHRIWLAVYGEGPWPCHRCAQPVDGFDAGSLETRGLIHHEDRNHDNNALGNLRVMHHACHVAEHQVLTHRDLAALIRDRIRKGDMPQRFPPLLEMQKQYNVASMTVRKAMALLAAEGAVIIKPGRGTFIKPQS